MSLAIIKTGGKQYKVKENQVLKIEKIPGKKGDKVNFDQVLLVADDKAEQVEIGQPTLSKSVDAEILEQGRSRKVRVVKYKAKIRYHKVHGHRQHFTQVKITKISSSTAKASLSATAGVAKAKGETTAKKVPAKTPPASKYSVKTSTVKKKSTIKK